MGNFFLIIMFCSAIHVYTNRFVIRPHPLAEVRSPRRPAARAHLISSHKQRCWTVLSELQYKVAYNPNNFSLNWKQSAAGRAVEDSLQYIKRYVAGVWTKTAKEYFKMARNKSFDVRARFGAIYSASKTKKYLLKNSTIGNRLLFSESANTEFTCPENSIWWLLLPDSNLFLKFQNNFTAEFWVTCSNYFSEISPEYLLYQWKPIPEISVKNISNFFTRRDFLWTVGSF